MSNLALNTYNNNLMELDGLLKKAFSLNTYKSYCFDLTQFQNKIKKSLLEATQIDVLDYFESLKESFSNNTINRKISAISSVFNKLMAFGIIHVNPVSSAKKIKKNINLKTQMRFSLLERTEIEKLINNSRDRRLGGIIEFLANTGCRISEIIHLKNKNILTAGNDVIMKIIGKGNKERTLLIDINLYQKLKSIFSSDSDFLFVTKNNKQYDRKNLWKQIKRLSMKVLDRMDIHPHSFRHFAGTALKEQYGLDFTSHYLGHSDISITAKFYVHSDYSKIKPILVNK